MINFSLFNFLHAYRLLVQTRDQAMAKEYEPIDVADAELRRAVEWAMITLAPMASDEISNRLKIANDHVQKPTVTNGVLGYEIGHVLQLLEEKIKIESFFRYPRDKARLLRAASREWQHIWNAFNVKDDVLAGIDCFALGHSTASVFHMMRVAEVGLRGLGRERGIRLPGDKPIEYLNWNEILREVDERVKELGRTMSAGPDKDVALEFYNSVLIQGRALKDIYRNQTMHVRHQFNEPEAKAAIELTYEFMEDLCMYIEESDDEPIDWEGMGG
jgi:hypothetical protein